MKEADLKRTCEEFLQIYQSQGKLVFLRLNAGAFITQSGHWAKGCQKGTADLLVLMGESCPITFQDKPMNLFISRMIFIELKSDKGRQSADQKQFQSMVEAQGAEYELIRSLEALQEILEL